VAVRDAPVLAVPRQRANRSGVGWAWPTGCTIVCCQAGVRRLGPRVTAVEREVHPRHADGAVRRVETGSVLCRIDLWAWPPVDEVIDSGRQHVRMGCIDR